jgi:chromosome segregation ATPase
MNTEIFGIITIFVTNAATWFFSKRKYQEEVASQEILNLNSTFNFYKTIISDLEKRVGDMQTRMVELEKIIAKLDGENKELKKQLKKNSL